MKQNLFLFFCILCLSAAAQKKPLDHTVYDGWQNVGERALSNDGKYVVYAVNPQEGDGILYIQSTDGLYKKEIARGYGASITDDNHFVICKIRPFYKDTRDARIKKKRPDDSPKDSMAIVELGTDKITKIPRVRSFKIPDESTTGWMAYLLEKGVPDISRPGGRQEVDSLTRLNQMYSVADSLAHVADSIRNKANAAKAQGLSVLQTPRGEGGGGAGTQGGGGGAPGRGRGGAGARGGGAAPVAGAGDDAVEEGTELILRNLATGEERTYYLVSEYYFSKNGNVLLYETTKKTSDNKVQPTVVKLDMATKNFVIIFQKFNDAKSYVMDESGSQVAFLAERDSSSKALQKFYKLYYYKNGADSATLIASRNTNGMMQNWTVAEVGGGGGRGGGGGFRGGGESNMSFSKNGQRLFLGTAPVLPPKDTSLPDFDRVSVDIWHYNDDQVQPAQLKNMDADLRRSYLARYDFNSHQIVQLGNTALRNVMHTQEGGGAVFYATSDTGRRIASQWQGFTVSDVYAVNPETGRSELIRKNLKGGAMSPSYSGKYLVFFDEIKQNYFAYNSSSKQLYPIAKDISFKLYDEENDVPDDPNAYGVAKWMENDKYVLLYDHFDIWQVDPEGKEKSVCLTAGRKDKIQYRYINTDREERFIPTGSKIMLHVFDERDKSSGLAVLDLSRNVTIPLFREKVAVGGSVLKAKDADVYSFTKESFAKSPDVYSMKGTADAIRLSYTNPQQVEYNWGSAELFKWKAYTGKETEGVLYKPEDFDPKKKYPMIVYFYERNNNTLYNYQPPAPTPSRLNIPFFVSRGYIVFVPDIWYKTGYPGQSAYDYIVSGTRAVVKQGYVDSTKLGLQGQSWGGYQIVYLITKTNLYAAAWAGAPVANMTSAYGGIRWGTGILRQFQYEKTQSRIGGTLWEKPDLYIKNSALFSLPKVKTPLVIMANDADDAVPWYQGIEMYSGMRRLGKKVWMLTYNGEAHNLVERKNRKDIQIREQQFFDYMLKGDKPSKWISEGVPAVMKGRDLGLGY